MIINNVRQPVECSQCGLNIETGTSYIRWDLINRTSLHLHPSCAKILSHALYGHIQSFERKQRQEREQPTTAVSSTRSTFLTPN